MANIATVLEELTNASKRSLTAFSVKDKTIAARIESVCRCLANRAGVRLLMACMLAKLENAKVDPREPYTEIGSDTCFSGRTYDESYVTAFIIQHKLPCNPTTAFLTPALRNLNRPLSADSPPVGRPPAMYVDSFNILNDVAASRASAKAVLSENRQAGALPY